LEVIEKKIDYGRPDKFFLYPLGDFHTGAVHFHEDLFQEKVKEIATNRKALWVGMGDYADLITPSDFKRWEGKILAPWMKGEEDNIGSAQLEKVDELLSPIWDKCLGLIIGNHDDAIRKYHHFDFMKELLKRANRKRKEDDQIPCAGVSCFLVLKFSRSGRSTNEIIIHARHGEGAARTSGARALAVLRLSQSMVNAHITLMGHLHGQESPDIPQRLLYKRGKIKAFETIATMTGAWLRAYMANVPASYLERWGSPPSKLGCPRIAIEPDENMMTLEKTAITGDV
tara:strand:- start:31655 stop:32509 length:855 start_codon:yes stop_codon:yes gene_type:complete